MPLRTNKENSDREASIISRLAPQSDLQASESELREVDRLLRLVYHRNKNQHRTQKWWKWVGMLRRAVGKVLILERSGGWRRRKEEEKKVGLERWIREILMPRAWL